MDNSRSQTYFLGQETLMDELIQGTEVAKPLNATSSTETGDLMLQRILSSYETALMNLNCSGSIGVAATVVPDDDGFSWRKYGQKDVPGANFPRSYYRCTYRNLEGCLATKQVQRSDKDPHVFEVTYLGEHTCKIARSSNAGPPSDGDLDGVAKETKAPPFDASKKRKTMPRWTDQVRVNLENGLEKPLDDGFSWRKYGQKDVLGANFPRSYYRCTYRNLEGCLATKQVQRSDKDPHVFEVTYLGVHTCKIGQSSNAGPQSDGDLDGVAKETKASSFDASKKRKTMPRWTYQVRVNPENGLEGPHDDGFSWRKYGQKDVLGANFPRSYYRCANRYLEGCLAIKQVQRSDKYHDVFEVTYRGKHTCKIAQTNPSQRENREDMSTNTFSEPAGPQEIMACGEHLDTCQETTDISSFNSFTDFFQQTTTSYRGSSSSITDHHHHQDNKDFWGSFSPSFTSPSTSAADNFFFEDGHDSYGSPNSELSNTVNGCTSLVRQTAVNELILGMEVAKQLRLQLNPTSSIETRDLMLQIVSSYEKALMILDCSGSIGAQPHDAGIATAVVPGSPRSLNASPPSDGDLDGVVKESQAPPFETSKKRKTVPRWTYQVRVNPENGLEGPHDDGFSWSKYGQKDILGAAFPRSRSYYRCTYRNLEGCLATKKEQRSEEDPYIIEGTYCGKHTCKIARTDPSKPEIQEQWINTITFPELANPQEIIECDDHLDTSQETTVVPSFNSFIHFLKETTTSSRDSTSSIIDHHHHRDNQDFRGSFSPPFKSPSTSAADDSFFGDGYESYGNRDSELNNILNGDGGKCVATCAEEELVNCRRFETFDLKTDYLLLLLVPLRSIALNLRAECLVEVYLPGSNNALVQDLVNLKQLDLSCSSFTRIPDLSRARKLQSLDLHCCNNLIDVSFIQYLTNLEYINLKGCTSLTRLPSLMALKLLLSLDLSDCINLRGLPPSLGCLSSLAALDLSNCKRIQNLPKGILRLKSVQTLSISGCSMLMEQASGPDGMLIENQVNPRAHGSSHASVEEVSMSYLPVDKYVPKIPLQQPEEERIISKYNSMASKDAAEPSSTTEDLELHKEVLKAYMNTPVEAIHQANAFYYVQRTVDSFIRQSPNSHESTSLHDLTYYLEELQDNVPETMSRMHDARVSKASIQVKLAHLRSSFVQSEGHYNGLAARLSVISDEEEDLDAEIDRLLAKRRELLD